MNLRLWSRIGLGVFVLAVLLLELAALASARRGFVAFFWPLIAIVAIALLAVSITAIVQLVRSRFRFSLGSLLLAFAVLALVLPLILGTLERIGRYRQLRQIIAGAHSWRTQHAVPEWMQQFFGKDLILAFCEIKDLEANAQSGDEWIALLDDRLGLETLSLTILTTEEGIARVSKITTLRTLHVPGAVLTDDALNPLSKLPNLEVLWTNKPASRFGLKALVSLPKLRTLHLAGPQLTDADLMGLAELDTRVTRLSVSDSWITDVGLQHIAKLKSLESLHLHCCARGPGLVHLAKLPRLRELTLTLPFMNESALACLKGCPSLRVLDLGSMTVTDAGLLHLEGMPNLREVHLNVAKATEEGIARFHRAMPNTEIIDRGMMSATTGPGMARPVRLPSASPAAPGVK